MNQNNSKISSSLRTAWFTGTIIVFVYLVLRNAGLQPVVMADEWYYSSFSRLLPLADVSIPSYLYLLLFKTTTSCGSGFLECTRLINVIVFVGAAPLIYLVAQRFMSSALASGVTLLAIIGPVNSYTAYFMPESLYFFSFWLLTCSIFRFHDLPSQTRAIELGFIMGVLALIKVHALFLLPSAILFMMYSGYSNQILVRGKSTAFFIVLALLTAVLVRFGVGYLCAGRNGLNLLGALYSQQAAQSHVTHASTAQFFKLMIVNLRGHVLGLVLLFGVPIAALASRIANFKNRSLESHQFALALYSLLMLTALLAITVGFTASVAGSGQESNFRLHMRYYNFAFPLLTMIAAAFVNSDNTSLPRSLTIGIAIPVILIIIYGMLKQWQPYTPSFVDSPELQGMTSKLKVFYILSTLGLVSIGCWAFSQKLGARIFLGMYMPLFSVLAGIAINHEVRDGGAENQFDRASVVTRSYLNEAQISQVGIVGSDASGVFRAQFHLDNAKIWQHIVPQGSEIEAREIPPSVSWLLIFGNYNLPSGAVAQVKGQDFSIVELNAQFPNRFSYEFASGTGSLLYQTEGLSGIEPWGRWSDQKIVTLHFSKPLPKRFKLRLLAEAYGPNAGENVVIRVGSQQQTTQLDKAKKNVEFIFETDGSQKTIGLEVPKPTPPSSLGKSEDTRKLGIGFTSLNIDSIDTTEK